MGAEAMTSEFWRCGRCRARGIGEEAWQWHTRWPSDCVDWKVIIGWGPKQ